MQSTNVFPVARHMRHLGHAPLSTILLERECLAFGLSTERTSRQTFLASCTSGGSMAFNKSGTVLSSRPAAPLSQNKHSTRVLLQKRGVPVPRGRRFHQGSFSQALNYAEELGYPVVLKPVHGGKGRGVVTGILTREELERAYYDITRDELGHDDFLVEEEIEGDAYRVLVVGDSAVSVLISRRGTVTGDGRRTVRQLVRDRQMVRDQNPHLMSRPIPIDDRLQHLLRRQQCELDTVLEPGRVVDFTYGSNTHLGGEPAQVLAQTHPSILEASVRAVRAVPGLGVGGVDFLIPRIDRPLGEQRAAICEVNSLPAVDSHEYPLFGDSLPVAREMVQRSAAYSGIQLSGYRSNVRLAVTFHTSNMTHRCRFWLRSRARAMGLKIRMNKPVPDRAFVQLQGEVHAVAVWLANLWYNPYGVAVRGVVSEHV